MPSSIEWECQSAGSSSSSSSESSLDDDQLNARLSPQWSKYRDLILSKGYRLDTVRDVREHYQRYGVGAETRVPHLSGYRHTYTTSDDSALCKDPGLPENLFRATCCTTGMKLMVKAVNRLGREVQNVRHMSSSHLRRDPMNHCIPVLDVIDVYIDGICFIVMEEWSSHLLPEIPSKLRDFLGVIHQCIEHITFMHRNCMVHLDISLHNFLADYHGRCACIDYELSRRIDDLVTPGTYWPKGTEVPPELERGQARNLYMVDVWALGILILRACKIANLDIPELLHLTRPMLNHNPDKRPPAAAVLQEFKRLVLLMGEERLNQPC
ncbi:kinase-like protein [Butyriboletus roseoflavus]|nr:kinase-like protein [Butyriboletus roseoflavus]